MLGAMKDGGHCVVFRREVDENMNGKQRFTAAEVQAIRDLLQELRPAEPLRQKAIRGALRNTWGFWISDWDQSRQGFTVRDFDDLVERGIVSVED